MSGLLLFAQLAVFAHGPDTATTCVPFEVTVAARAPGTVAPRITPPPSTGSLQLLRRVESTGFERDGAGRSTALTEATFTFATDGVGRVELPAFVASVGTLRASAAPSPLEAQPSGVLAPTVIVRAWLNRGAASQASDTLFVGQQVDYVVDVQLNEAARLRLRRNPTFFPPEMPGVLAYDLAAPAALTRVGRRCFETLSYRRALFPLFAGRTAIAPAALTYSLPLSTSFFSREESVELRTDTVRFVAIEVPTAKRPADFTGAVGSIGATVRLSTSQARMGDPVVLTLRLEGTGNVKLWPRPSFDVAWASIATGGERVQVDTSRAIVRGTKEFDWLLTPRRAGKQVVPALEYPYFDVGPRDYQVARTAPLSLEIAVAPLASVDSAPVARYGIRRTLRDEKGMPVPSQPWYWLLLAIAPAPAALRRLRDVTRRRSGSPSSAARLRDAARSTPLPPRDVRRLFLQAVSERVPTATRPTRADEFGRALRLAGVTERTADAAEALLTRLDEAAFSSAGHVDTAALLDAVSLVRAIDAQALPAARIAAAMRTLTIVWAFAASISAVAFALPSSANRAFQEGVQAYDQGAFTASQRHFARVVGRGPRAVDAWVNLGTAAWARGDSAAAARGWQRALRLDPLDADARERLSIVQPAVLGAHGFVPPVPVNAVALAALGAWLAAWGVLALPRSRRPRHSRALAGAAVVIATVGLAATLETRDRLDPHGLAVLRTSRLLLDAPSSATALAAGHGGETGRLGAREGAWVRLALDGDRAGWVPVAGVLLLDAPSIDD